MTPRPLVCRSVLVPLVRPPSWGMALQYIIRPYCTHISLPRYETPAHRYLNMICQISIDQSLCMSRHFEQLFIEYAQYRKGGTFAVE